MVLVRGGRQGIRLGEESSCGNCTRTKGHFLYDLLGWCPERAPCVPRKWGRGPHSPQCTLALPGQTEMFTRTAFLPVLSQGGGKQDTDSLDVISFTAL